MPYPGRCGSNNTPFVLARRGARQGPPASTDFGTTVRKLARRLPLQGCESRTRLAARGRHPSPAASSWPHPRLLGASCEFSESCSSPWVASGGSSGHCQLPSLDHHRQQRLRPDVWSGCMTHGGRFIRPSGEDPPLSGGLNPKEPPCVTPRIYEITLSSSP